jgi:hypothetical protein
VTDILDAQHQARLDAWAASPAFGRPPEDPARVLYEELHITLEDETGTEFRCMAGQTGGQYTEWSSTATYQPAPTGTLTLVFDSATGRQTVRIPAS